MKTLSLIAFVLLAARTASAQNAGWVELGESGSEDGLSDSLEPAVSPSLALAGGSPVVAFSDSSTGAGEILVRRWDGSAWVGLGGPGAGINVSGTLDYSRYPSLAWSAAGSFVVAWEEGAVGSADIHVRRWDPVTKTWAGMDGTDASVNVSNSAGNSSYASLVLDASGSPVVAWQDATPGVFEIYIRRWDPVAKIWAAYDSATFSSASGGGISVTSVASERPSLALDSLGRPVVAWQENPTARKVFLRRWNGSTWIDLGPSASGGGISNNYALMGVAFLPSLAIDASDNPVVAWSDRALNTNNDIRVRRWNGSAWVGFDGTEASLTVSLTSGISLFPSLALDPSGAPVVAWSDSSNGSFEIYVRRWGGSSWDEVGEGSGTGGGISASTGNSAQPRMKLGPAGEPAVAWDDATLGDPAIYFRRVPPPPAPPDLPAQLAQWKPGGMTPIPPGGLVTTSGFVATAVVSDSNGDRVSLEIEVDLAGQAFTGSNTVVGPSAASGGMAVVTVEGLAFNEEYHWRLRAVDQGGAVSAWVSYSGDPESIDLRPVSRPPLPPPVLQADPAENRVIAPGVSLLDGGSGGARIEFRATLSDPDPEDALRLEVEVRPLGLPFTGEATATSEPIPSGSIAVLSLSFPRGRYHWQARASDAAGNSSAWEDYGGNGGSEADFSVGFFGSGGGKGCAQSSGAAIAPAVLLVLALIRRR